MIRNHRPIRPVDAPMIEHPPRIHLQEIVAVADIGLLIARPKPIHRIQPVDVSILIILKPRIRLHHPALVPHTRRHLNHRPQIHLIIGGPIGILTLRIIHLPIGTRPQIQHRPPTIVIGGRFYPLGQSRGPLLLNIRHISG